MIKKTYFSIKRIILTVCTILILLTFINSCASYSNLRSESVTLFEEGKNEEALEKLAEAMEMSPGLKEDYLLKSNILEKLGRKEEAGVALGEYQKILNKLLEDLRVINNELEIKGRDVELFKQKLALLQKIHDENNDKSKEIEELQKQIPLIEIENKLAQVNTDLENDQLNLKLWKQKQELLLQLDRQEEAEEVVKHMVEVEKELAIKEIEAELRQVNEHLAENPEDFALLESKIHLLVQLDRTAEAEETQKQIEEIKAEYQKQLVLVNNELEGNPGDIELLNKKHSLLLSLGKETEAEGVHKEILLASPETLVNGKTIILNDKEITSQGLNGMLPADTSITILGIDYTFKGGTKLSCRTDGDIHKVIGAILASDVFFDWGVNKLSLQEGTAVNFSFGSPLYKFNSGTLAEGTTVTIGKHTIPAAGGRDMFLGSDGKIIAIYTSDIVNLTVGPYTLPFSKGYRIVFTDDLVWKGVLAEDTTVVIGTTEVTFAKNQEIRFFTNETRTSVFSSGRLANDQTFGDVQKKRFEMIYFDRDGNFLR